MQAQDLGFWKETYALCRDIAERARREMKDNRSLWESLDRVASGVPVVLLTACLTDDNDELRRGVMDAFSRLQLMQFGLFALGLRGALEEAQCREYLRRCSTVSCAILAFVREQNS